MLQCWFLKKLAAAAHYTLYTPIDDGTTVLAKIRLRKTTRDKKNKKRTNVTFCV